MPLNADQKDIGLLLESKVPILVIESYEEPRVLEMITRLAVSRTSPLYIWSVTEGLNRLGFGSGIESESSLEEPAELLKHIKACIVPGIYVLCDFHPFIKDEKV